MSVVLAYRLLVTVLSWLALLATCVELNDRPFDQAHPLWEIWLLTGPLDGHVSMLIRFHHVLADGIAALLLLDTLFDSALIDSAPEAPESQGPTWAARPIPTRSELLSDALRRSITGIGRAVHKIEHPQRTLAAARTLFLQALQLAREGRVPRTSFNRPVGRRRRVLLVRADLEQAKQVAHAHHATVNDVVLCAIAGGARALLAGRGELQRPLVLKVSVAASVRAATSASQAGNLVGVLLVPVAVGEPDPIRRLEQIARATAERKRLPPYQPAARFLQRWLIRAMDRQRLINLLMSNLPGPPQLMYFADAKILEVFQIEGRPGQRCSSGRCTVLRRPAEHRHRRRRRASSGPHGVRKRDDRGPGASGRCVLSARNGAMKRSARYRARFSSL